MSKDTHFSIGDRVLIKNPELSNSQKIKTIIDFSEGCLITKARSRKYRSNHKHIDPAVLRGDDPHSVHNDLYGYVILIKNILESINATDVLVEKINEWFSGNYRFTYVSIKDRLLQLNLIPAS